LIVIYMLVCTNVILCRYSVGFLALLDLWSLLCLLSERECA